MGGALSKEEDTELTGELGGIDPTSMAAIVWDTINNIGVDNEMDKFGISFEGDKESSKVTFWDKGDATEMPKRVFLEVIEAMCNGIIKAYETDYDLDQSPELNTGIDKLKMAHRHLQMGIEALTNQEGALEYRRRLDSQVSVETNATAEEMVAETRQRRGSMSWSNANLFDSGRRRSSNRGLEAVIDRLPELRRRYETATRKTKPMLKVRKKIMALGIFGSKIHRDQAEDIEQEEEQIPSKKYTRQRRHTLVVPTEAQLSLARLARPDSGSSNSSNELATTTVRPIIQRRVSSVGDIS